MPINQSIWKISNNIEMIKEIKLESETELEDILQKKIEILNDNWLIIGRQVITEYNKYIDLLAIDNNASLIIIELKKDKTPRDVVAQAIDYASWVKTLEPEKISNIFDNYDHRYLNSGKSLDQAFQEKYSITLEEEELNNSHQIYIAAAELDSSTERIVTYLNDSHVPVNVVFFKVFKIGTENYLSRAWLIDPYETSDIATTAFSKTKEPWNGEYYVSFGEGPNRRWEEAVKYGFICAGGGIWYSRTLNQLNTGNRVWVNIPRVGYVGVGEVIETAKKANEVFFDVEGSNKTIYDISDAALYHKEYINDDDKAEYIVKIKWIKTVDNSNAISEIGFFGNQNSVCKPTTPKWNTTISRLKELWNIQ